MIERPGMIGLLGTIGPRRGCGAALTGVALLLVAAGGARAAETPSALDEAIAAGDAYPTDPHRPSRQPEEDFPRVISRAAGDCPERWEAASGPLPGGADPSQPADFGAIPEACPGSDLVLRLRGSLLDDSAAPGFFGDVLTDVMLRGRRRIGAHGWLSVAVDLFNYRYVNDASLASTGPSFGPPTIGYYHRLAATFETIAAVYGRVLLPLDTARQSGIETGLEVGVSGRARASRRWAFDGGLAIAGPLDVVAGQAHARLDPGALAEAWFSPRPALALFGGGSLRVELAPTATLLTVIPRAGLRAALRRSLWLAFLAEAPVAGTDRTNLIASLFVGWSP